MPVRARVVVHVLLSLFTAGPAAAQTASTGAAEIGLGWAGFVDEGLINHSVFAGSVRLHVSPRLSIGPELAYMLGPGGDRDLFVTGNLTFDIVTRTASRRAIPFLVIGGGLMRHQDQFGPARFSSTEGAVTGGGGVRVWLNDRVYALGEFRGGWEPHMRVSGAIGVGWP